MPIEMMAIGDSIYNGVRSLTIDADLAAHSVPAQVAAAFRWDFISPDYPRVMLANFEQVFSDPLAGTLNLIKSAATNAHAWLADDSWSQNAIFHNLSIAQQVVSDIATANYSTALATAEQLAAKVARCYSLGELLNNIALNTCFVLNPQRTPGDKRTAIDILAEAKPKRLLINIGINDGLWELLLMGDATNYQKNVDPTVAMGKLAGDLRGALLRYRLEGFLYQSPLPQLSSASRNPGCLRSRRLGKSPSGGVSSIPGWLVRPAVQCGRRIMRRDRWSGQKAAVLELRAIRAAYAPLGPRTHFVDLYAMNAAYDRKNGIATKSVIVKSGAMQVLFDNLPLEVLPIIGGRRDGGLFGLDNLHPTVIGYGLIAQAVCDTISVTEGLAPQLINLQSCYDADTLLHNLPAQIALADFVLGFIGAFISGDSLASIA